MWGNINFVLERDLNQTISAVLNKYEQNQVDGSHKFKKMKGFFSRFLLLS